MQRLFLECAVRAALIVAGTAAVLGIMRVKTAAARHAAWAGVVFLMLALPVWTAWGPKAGLSLLPSAVERRSAGAVVLLDRAFVAPVQPSTMSGPAGKAIIPEPRQGW